MTFLNSFFVSISKHSEPSLRTKRYVEEFLYPYGVHFDDLNEKQGQCVREYIGEKKLLKWLVIVSIFVVVFCLFSLVMSYKSGSLISKVFDFHQDKVSFDGRETIAALEPETTSSLIGIITDLSYLRGFLTATVICMALSLIGDVIIAFQKIRRQKKLFDAFLPFIKRNESFVSQNNL